MRRRFEGSFARTEHACRERLACWSSTWARPREVHSHATLGPEPVVELDPAESLWPLAGDPVDPESTHSEGAAVLSVPEIFCLTMARGIAAPKEEGSELPREVHALVASFDGDSVSSGCRPEWLPCSLTLTENVLQLTGRSEIPSARSSGTPSTKASDARCILSVPLAHIVDVASSVCIFGSIDKSHGGPIASRKQLCGSEDAPPAHADTLPAASEAAEQSECSRQRLLRQTNSKFAEILRSVPQSDLQLMLQHVGPYDFCERQDASTFMEVPLARQHSPGAQGAAVMGQALSFAVGNVSGWESAVDEQLSVGVAVGAFDLPPIPLARLPETRSGLPIMCASRSAASSSPKVNASVFGAFAPGPRCPLPLSAYDASNCQPEQAFGAAIPPIPPSNCRLPQRTHREVRSNRDTDEVTAVVDARGTPYPHVLVVWTTSCASLAKSSGHTRSLQDGAPILIAFAAVADAEAAREVILRYRAARLDEWTGDSAVAGDPASPFARARSLSPRFGESGTRSQLANVLQLSSSQSASGT